MRFAPALRLDCRFPRGAASRRTHLEHAACDLSASLTRSYVLGVTLPQGSVKTVLVVDDSATMRRMIIASLASLGAVTFEQAVSGLEAIERLTISAVDLVMLDLNMPDMHGLEVLRFIRAQESFRELPVVVLTTRGDDDSRVAAAQAGATLYLTKPFQPAAIVAQVQPLLRTH